jgi:RNA binding exosome subunit
MPEAAGTESFFARIVARAYARATEIPERVETALFALFPSDVHERVKIERFEARGHLSNPIIVLTASLQHKASCAKTVSSIFHRLSETDRGHLLESLNDRLDDDCHLFLRFDKQAAYLGSTQLAKTADVILVRVLVQKYPRCSFEEAETLIRTYLEPSGGST